MGRLLLAERCSSCSLSAASLGLISCALGVGELLHAECCKLENFH